MSQDFYNNEERQYKDVIGILKQLPKIKAENNFEYNLMTRIQNGNFDSKSLKRNEYTLWGFLKPGIAVAVTAVLLFFIIDFQQSDFDNPLLSEPKKRSEMAKTDHSKKIPKEFVVVQKAPPASVASVASSPTENTESSMRVLLHDNDVLAEDNTNFPFPDNSVNLDSRLRENNNTRSMNDSRVLAGTGTERVYFEGFYTGANFNQKVLDSLRNLDSLRRSK